MALSKAFDPMFRRWGGSIPVPFLRALSKRESNQNPAAGGGSYFGLFQVGYKNVLPSYNSRHGTSYTPQDLFKPDVNTKIISEFLGRIVDSYKRHPSPNMKENWSNREFIKLLVAGHNSGYSEAGGVGRVARFLEERSIPVTHDNVFTYAATAGATKHLSNIKKRNWQRSVSDLYFAQPDRPTGGLLALAAVLFVGWGVYTLVLK